ncbi:hypothetical protein ACFOGJ_18055 [Marinibaculum pumilum]|uniref:Uncharacterized protein n=1 Tax=Marinibaculum pumilum TaxID=1766165 RepID=A0ABV7L446_9PROT
MIKPTTDFRAVAAAALTESAPEPIRSGFDPLANDQDIAPGGLSAGETAEFEQQRRNQHSQIHYTKENDILLAEQGEMIAGRILSGSATARLQDQAAQQEEKAKRAHQNYMDILMADIARLNREIASLEERIAEFEDSVLTPEERAEIDALPEDEQFDATDRILREKVANGTLSQSGYDYWRSMETELAGKKDELEQKNEQMASADRAQYEKLQGLKEQLGTKIADLERAQRESVMSHSEITAEHEGTLEGAEAAASVEMTERELIDFELKQYEGTDFYNQKADELIKNADPHTLDEIIRESTDPELVTRIKLSSLKSDLKDLKEGFGNDPDYAQYVEMAINEASDEVKHALASEEDLSPEVTAALYPPFSDELDRADGAQQEAQQRTAALNNDAKPPAPTFPGMEPPTV